MNKSLSRGQMLALKSTKIVSSQPPSQVEQPEESPTRRSGRSRAKALSQSPVETMPTKNRKDENKKKETRTTPTTTKMQNDLDGEMGDRDKTPIRKSSSSGTVTLVRSGSATTTQIQAMNNGMSNTPQPDITTSASRSINRERSYSGDTSSNTKNKNVVALHDNGLSDDIEDDSSEDIEDNKKRKRHSRRALDECFDHSDEDISKDNNHKRQTESAGKNRYKTRKLATQHYEEDDTYTTKSYSGSRPSTPKEDNFSGKIHGKQDAPLLVNEAAIGNLHLCFTAKLATHKKNNR